MTRTAPFFRFETAPRDFKSWVYALALGLALVMPILQRVQRALPAKAAAESGYRLSDNYKTDAYGVELATSGVTDSANRFAGEQFDFDLGMQWLRSRYLNSIGRFQTFDNYEGPNTWPEMGHKYIYGAGNPQNRIDPSGMLSAFEMGTALGVMGTIYTQLNILHGVFDRVGNQSSAVPDGFMLNVSLGGGYGLGAAYGASFVFDVKSSHVWFSEFVDATFNPFDFVVKYKGLNVKPTAQIGPIYNMDSPLQLNQVGVAATMPFGLVPYLTTTRNPIYNWFRKYTPTLRKISGPSGSVTLGYSVDQSSTNTPAYALFGPGGFGVSRGYAFGYVDYFSEGHNGEAELGQNIESIVSGFGSAARQGSEAALNFVFGGIW